MNRLLDKYLPVREGEGTGSGGSADVEAPAGTVVTPPPAGDVQQQLAAAESGKEQPHVESAEQTKQDGAPAPLTAADITLPEGFTADEPMLNSFLEIANNSDLDPKARANALTNLYADGVKKMQESLAADWIARNKKWADEIRADPEIGGQNMQQSEAYFAQVIAEFGDDQLVRDLIETGAGNRLSFARLFAKIGKVMSEGKPLVGDPTSETAVDRASKLYPNQGQV